MPKNPQPIAFPFTDPNGQAGRCDLTWFRLDDGRTAVIAAERADNAGMSVTNGAGPLATFVCHRLDIEPRLLVWIDHWPAALKPREGATWDLARFEVRNTRCHCAQCRGGMTAARDWALTLCQFQRMRPFDFFALGMTVPRELWEPDVEPKQEA